MKLLVLLLACFGVMNALVVDVVKLRCNQSPFEACAERGCLGVVASSQNKFDLINLLKQNNVKSAYVFGYDNNYMLMVLHANGALAPYEPYTNTSGYVLCAGECPCPVYGAEKRPAEGSRPANPSTGGYPCNICEGPVPQPEPRYEGPASQPAQRYDVIPSYDKDMCREIIVNSCREKYIESCSSSSSSSSSCEDEKCKIFPKKCKKSCKARSRCHRRCPTKIIELLTNIKTYTFDTRRYRRRGDVVVKVCSKDTKAKYQRFVISRNGEVYNGENKRCIPDSLPRCLKCPRELLRLKRYIERKFCDKKVCLYINDKCDIYVLVDGRFYQVIKRDGRRRRPHLRRIRGGRLRRLICNGLYGVEFGAIDCN